MRRGAKYLTKLGLLVWIGVGAVLGAAGATRLFAEVSRSAETNEIFNAAATIPPELINAVTWEPDRSDLKRQMEPLTRADVTASWIRAWEQLSIVAQTGDTTGLEVYFANSALQALLESAEDIAGLPVHQLSHKLRVEFYSHDGQVIGLSADDVQLLRPVLVDGVVGWRHSAESYDAVMVLEDGNWRIQHWVRRTIEQRWWTEAVPPATAADQLDPNETSDLAVNGINYYPRDTPFKAFWPTYDPSIVAEDLDTIAAAGFDSVRIFLPFDELGGRWTTTDDLAPVVDFLDAAATRDLGVVITLFDGRTDHRAMNWNADVVHLQTVVSQLQDHPALLMWDLKNEADRDIGANGVDEQLLYAWIGHVAHEVRALDSTTPMTVGWSTPEAALAAPVQTDIVSFHFYAPVEELLLRAPQIVEHAEGRPVILTEFGLPSWNSIFPRGNTEAHQAAYLADVLDTARQSEIEGTMVWTLWDLAAAPPDAGSMAWNTGPQTNLGLLRSDGSEKPGLSVMRPGFDLDSVRRTGPLDRLQLTFWRLALVLVGSVAVGAGVVAKRPKARRPDKT